MKPAEPEKEDHLAQYQKLMRESGAHQRAADALAQSHQDEDRPIYEHHAGKAWRLGTKAMEHFKRMTKEQRSMLKDQAWTGMQPQQQGFGGQRKQFGGGQQGFQRKMQADWQKFDEERGKGGKDAGQEEHMKQHAHLLQNGFKVSKARAGHTEYTHSKRDGSVILYPRGDWEHENSKGETVSVGQTYKGLRTHTAGMTNAPMRKMFGSASGTGEHEFVRANPRSSLCGLCGKPQSEHKLFSKAGRK